MSLHSGNCGLMPIILGKRQRCSSFHVQRFRIGAQPKQKGGKPRCRFFAALMSAVGFYINGKMKRCNAGSVTTIQISAGRDENRNHRTHLMFDSNMYGVPARVTARTVGVGPLCEQGLNHFHLATGHGRGKRAGQHVIARRIAVQEGLKRRRGTFFYELENIHLRHGYHTGDYFALPVKPQTRIRSFKFEITKKPVGDAFQLESVFQGI